MRILGFMGDLLNANSFGLASFQGNDHTNVEAVAQLMSPLANIRLAKSLSCAALATTSLNSVYRRRRSNSEVSDIEERNTRSMRNITWQVQCERSRCPLLARPHRGWPRS